MFVFLMLIAYTIINFMLYPFFSEKLMKNENYEKMLKKECSPLKFFGSTEFLKALMNHLGISFIIIMLLASSKNKGFIIISIVWIIQFIIEFLVNLYIDYSKSKNQVSREFRIMEVVVFFTKQLVQFAIIIKASFLIINYEPQVQIIKLFVTTTAPITEIGLKKIFIAFYLALSGGQLISLIYNLVYSNIDCYDKKLNSIMTKEIEVEQDTEEEKMEKAKFIDEISIGKWIGILERFLIVIFMFINQFSGLAVIISIKTLARFKMLENKIFGEYYLIGTMVSVSYTLIGFILLNRFY